MISIILNFRINGNTFTISSRWCSREQRPWHMGDPLTQAALAYQTFQKIQCTRELGELTRIDVRANVVAGVRRGVPREIQLKQVRERQSGISLLIPVLGDSRDLGSEPSPTQCNVLERGITAKPPLYMLARDGVVASIL